MFIFIGVAFFVLPILILIFAFFTQFTSPAEDETTAATSIDPTTTDPALNDDTSRLLQGNGLAFESSDDSSSNDSTSSEAPSSSSSPDEPLNIIRWWIFISLIAIITFSFSELSFLMIKLFKQYNGT